MSVRKILYSILVFGLLSVTLWSLLPSKGKKTPPQTSHTPSEKKISGKKLAYHLRAPRNIKRQISSQSHVSKPCKSFWSYVQELDLNDFSFPPSLPVLQTANQCTNAPEAIQKAQEEYGRFCAPFFSDFEVPDNEKKWNEKSRECILALFLLRANISTWNTRNQNLNEISDLSLLSDGLAIEFYKLTKGNTDPKKLIEVSERLLEVDATLYEASKAVLLGHIFGGELLDKSKWDDGKYWTRMEKLLDRAESLSDHDRELSEISRMIRTRGYQPEYVKQYATQTLAKNPNSVEGHYFLAYSEWKMGNHDAAIQALAYARRINPKNRFIQQAWKRVNQPNRPSNAFQRTMSFRLNLLNLLEE